MIPFFRKIRKKLANDNQFIKYSRYAIGEILLVVIGILIALQINNLNELRKDNLKSKVYIDKIVNDIVSDTLNISSLIEQGNAYKSHVQNYFSFFNQGHQQITKLIDSSTSFSASYLRYFPVNNTFLDMQFSGNTSLLSDEQKAALIELSSAQEFLKIIIEKVVSGSQHETQERDKYLGYPNDFFDKIGESIKREDEMKGLIHQHLRLKKKIELYDFIDKRGSVIKEQSKKAIDLLTK